MGQNGRRDTKIGIFPALCIDPRRRQQQFTGVNEILIAGIAFEAVPARARLKAKETPFAGDGFGRMILPGTSRHHRWNKRLDHFAVGDNRLARFDTQRHAFRPQAAPALSFVNFGIYVQSGEQRIKRAGRGVQHKGVIEPLMRAKTFLSAQVIIFFMDLRRLRKTGLLFVHRLSDKNTGVVRRQVQQQRRTVGHHRDKLLVADPGRVKQDVVAQAADFIDHLAGVVYRPVISPELDHREAERPLRIGFFRRRLANQIAQVFFIKAAIVDTANKTERVARCFKIDRRCPGLNQRPVMV